MIANSLKLTGVLGRAILSRPVAGFATTSIKRRSSGALLSPCGGGTIMKTLHPTVVLSNQRTFSTESKAAVISKEELSRLADAAAPRVQEEKRLKEEAERPEREARQVLAQAKQEAKRLHEEATLQQVEHDVMKKVEACMETCRKEAVENAAKTYRHRFAVETLGSESAFIQRKMARLLEVLKRELPLRLPGVAFVISKPEYWSHPDTWHEDYYVHVDFNWGDM